MRMYKYMRSTIVVVVVFFSIFLNVAYGAVIYVDGNLPGNCTDGTYDISSRSCGSGSDGNAYTTITAAISVSSDNDTISIRSGTYTETNMSTTGKNDLTITGHGTETVTIQGTTVYQDVFSVGTPTTFRNLTLKGTKYGPPISSQNWAQYSEHIWYATEDHPIIQIYFNWNEGARVMSIGDVDSNYRYYRTTKAPYKIYVYVPTPNTNPAVAYSDPGMRETSEYYGNAFRGTGPEADLVTIDNCDISGFSHCGVKLNKRWHIKNCYFHDNGSYNDGNDHHLYISSRATPGNEVIIEHNRFGYTPGRCICHYSDPAYFIIRYNIFDGSDEAPAGVDRRPTGISLNGENTQIYGNTITNCYIGIHIRLHGSHNNAIKNNLLYANGYDLAVGFYRSPPSYPVNNIVTNNFLGSTNYCAGCTNETANGGDDYATYYSSSEPYNNIVSSNKPFVALSPSNWYDLRLGSGSECINAGTNLGSVHNDALDPNDTTWPPSTADQGSSGTGWEIGAFVFREGSKLAPVKWKDPPFE